MSVIMMKNKGHIIPAQLLEKVIEDNPSSFGVAQVVPAGLQVSVHPGKAPIDKLNIVQEKFKENTILFHFGKYPAGVNKDDLQPMVVQRVNDVPTLIAFMEGDFSGHHEQSSSHTNEFLAFNKDLRPRLEKFLKANDGDIKKFLDDLRDPPFSAMIERTWVTRGHITLMANDGQVITWAKPGPAAFEWGWTTNAYADVQKVDPPKEDSLDDVLGAGKPKETPVIVHQEKRKSVIATETAPAPTAPTSVPVIPKDMPKEVEFVLVKMRPPKDVTGHNQLKKWYRSKNHDKGVLPANWKERPDITVAVKKEKADQLKLKSFGELKEHLTVNETPEKVEVTKVVEEKTEEPEKKVEAPPKEVVTVEKKKSVIAAAAPKKEESKAQTEMSRLYITPEQQTALLNDMTEGQLQKIIDASNKTILPPEEMAALEGKTPTFWEKSAINFEETAGWKEDVFLHLVEKHPMALARLAMDLRTCAHLYFERSKKQSEAIQALTSTPTKRKSVIAA